MILHGLQRCSFGMILDKCFLPDACHPLGKQPFLASDFLTATKTKAVRKREIQSHLLAFTPNWPTVHPSIHSLQQQRPWIGGEGEKERRNRGCQNIHPGILCTRNFSMSNGNQFRRKHVVDAPKGITRSQGHRSSSEKKVLLSTKSLYSHPSLS